MSNSIHIGSIFSGTGGLDLGFSEIPIYQTVLQLDKNSTAINTLRTNQEDGYYSGSHILERDILEVVEEVKQEEFSEAGADDIDILIGGPPCQPFSAAARRTGGTSGTDSDEGKLFQAYTDLLTEWQPTAFVFENVYGITSNEEDWRPIKESFNAAGYEVKPRTLDAADYGVPQHRIRTFIVGVHEDCKSEFFYPKPTHGPESDGGPLLNTAGDAINDLETPSDMKTYSINSKYADLLPEVPPGLNYSFFTEKLGHPDPKFAWRSRFSDFLYKAIPKEPLRTLKAQPGGANGPFHWDNRRFTEAELKRLQSFPDDYEVKGSYSKVVEQIGNSVPPRMANVIARSLAAQIFDWSPESKWYSRLIPYDEWDEPAVPDALPDDAELNFRSRKRTPLETRKQRAQKRLGDQAQNTENVDSDRAMPREFSFSIDENLSLLEGGIYHDTLEERRYSASSEVQDGCLNIEVARQGSSETGTVNIVLEADKGYLIPVIQVSQIEVEAAHVDIPDLMPIWSALVEDIQERTSYEKLMSVVGHYSCARDNFSSRISIENLPSSPVCRVISHFSKAENCNRYFTLGDLSAETGLSESDVVDGIEKARQLRYDIRTPDTHSTIEYSDCGEPQILCTYPFPNLVAASPFDFDITLSELRTTAHRGEDEVEATGTSR